MVKEIIAASFWPQNARLSRAGSAPYTDFQPAEIPVAGTAFGSLSPGRGGAD